MKITIKGITKKYDAKQVISPTDIEIASGNFTTLLGPSGCGKTTLLRMIAGLETPDSGEIWFDERLVYSDEQGINVPPEKRNLGFVFQDFALWPHMTVYENVAFGLRARKDVRELDLRVRDSLHIVRLDGYEKRYPHQLSGGQQQRVAFARAVAVRPDCILFDEPLSALDALLREEMRSELKELTSSLGLTSVFVTHDQTEAMSMSDKIAVLNGGTVEQYDTPESIYRHPRTLFTAHFVGKSNMIDETRMFRPESASFEEISGAEHFEVPVQNVQYMGGSYEMTALYGDKQWTLRSKQRVTKDEMLSVYIDHENIIKLQDSIR